MMHMEIREVTDNKKQYTELLLLGDEQETMIDRYLGRGTMFVLDDGGVRALCVVTDEGDRVLEIKNIAVLPAFQGKGYGRRLIRFLEEFYAQDFDWLQAGTSPGNVRFYEACGFRKHHIIKDFFTDNYDHPIFEDGVQLADMIVLRAAI